MFEAQTITFNVAVAANSLATYRSDQFRWFTYCEHVAIFRETACAMAKYTGARFAQVSHPVQLPL